MTIREARELVQTEAFLTWRDRNGEEQSALAYIMKADFVPFYGPCLFTEHGEIALDRVVSWEPPAAKAAA